MYSSSMQQNVNDIVNRTACSSGALDTKDGLCLIFDCAIGFSTIYI